MVRNVTARKRLIALAEAHNYEVVAVTSSPTYPRLVKVVAK